MIGGSVGCPGRNPNCPREKNSLPTTRCLITESRVGEQVSRRIPEMCRVGGGSKRPIITHTRNVYGVLPETQANDESRGRSGELDAELVRISVFHLGRAIRDSSPREQA